MKLYRVTVEHTFYMVSDDEELDMLDAEYCAREAVKEDIELDLIAETEVTSLDEVPKNFHDSCPYGEGGNERTIKEWLVG